MQAAAKGQVKSAERTLDSKIKLVSDVAKMQPPIMMSSTSTMVQPPAILSSDHKNQQRHGQVAGGVAPSTSAYNNSMKSLHSMHA